MTRKTLTQPDKGWSWVAMMASFMSHFLNGSVLFSAGIIHVSLLQRFGENATVTSWASGLYICFMSSAGIFGSILINIYSCRVAMMVGSIMMAIGMMASAFLNTLYWILISYGCLAGIGSGIVYTTQVVAIGLNFEKKRNMASGVATCGVGFGAFVLAPVYQAARVAYGNAGMFIILSGVSLNICVAGSLIFPSLLEQHLNLTKKEVMSSRPKRMAEKCSSLFKQISLLKNVSFLSLCLSLLSSHIGIIMVFVHLTNYSIANNSTENQASFLMAINGLIGCCSRLLTGLASNSDNIDEIVLYFGTFCVLGLATVLFPLYGKTYTGQVLFAIFLGLYAGCCFPLLNTVTTRIVGVANLVTAFGIEMFFCGIGVLVGPPIAGIIVDNGGTYEESFILAGFTILLGGIFGMGSALFLNQMDDNTVEAEESLEPEVQSFTREHLANTNQMDVFLSTPYGSTLSLNR